jgi:rubredoxin
MRAILNAWWKDGVQHTRWVCSACGTQYETISEAEGCTCVKWECPDCGLIFGTFHFAKAKYKFKRCMG